MKKQEVIGSLGESVGFILLCLFLTSSLFVPGIHKTLRELSREPDEGKVIILWYPSSQDQVPLDVMLQYRRGLGNE